MMVANRLNLGYSMLLALVACTSTPTEPGFDNPIIPDDPNYESPQTTIISGPAEGAIVDTHAVTFAWVGNQENMTFAYRINKNPWSDWTSNTQSALSYQDEGDYHFEVKGRYLSGVEEDSAAMRTYTIDDIHGPALRLYPRYQEVANGSIFTVEVILEEVENVFAVRVALAFDAAKLQVTHIDVYEDGTSLLKQNGGVIIPFSAYDNGTGTATIEVATATGDPPGVSGTGPIAMVTFRAVQAGQAFIIINQTSALRDPDNADVALAETVRAIVLVR